MKKSALLCCYLIFVFSACFNKQEKKETIYEGDLQEIRLGAMSSMDYIPFVIAQKTGIYDSLGLNVNIVKFFSANERDAAFQSGTIDGTVIDLTGAIIQQANGINLQVVMKNDGFFYFIAGKDTGIESLKELRGKNIAVSRNTVIEFSTDKAVESAGISPSEINKPEINKIPLRLEMLQNGQIDAGIFPDPFATIAKSNGHHSLTTTKELGISVTGTVFTEKAIREKEREIKVLIKGYNLAVEFIKENPLSRWASILVEDAGLPNQLINSIILPDYQPASIPEKKDISTTIEWLKNKNLIPENYTGEGLVNPVFVSKK